MRIIRDTELCKGCQACALACSFHHVGSFSPEVGSIKVKRENKRAIIEWSINSTCDSCVGEEIPLCVKYCVYGALGVA